MKRNTKAITPVVATALLLVVAVVAVVGFQTWFNTYSSSMFTKVETQSSNSMSNSGIQNVIGNTLYFKNSGTTNITITAVKVGNNDCNISGNFSSGMLTIPLGNNCTQNLTTSVPDIVVYTKNDIYSKNIYVSGVVSSSSGGTSSLNCSSLVGGTWIEVPGNSALGTSNFCVMKYDAKNISGVATSTATGNPWVSITQLSAQTACATLGPHYHLITNAEWTTIARNAENQSTNWNSSTIGVGTMPRGWSNPGNTGAAPYTNSSCLYNTGANTCGSTGQFLYRRTLYLSNGNLIWDLAGNVWDWNNDTCLQSNWYNPGAWIEWNSTNFIGNEKTLAGPFGSYTSTNGMGQYYGCTANGNVFLRGGAWHGGAYAGAFALNLGPGPSGALTNTGFRCSYGP